MSKGLVAITVSITHMKKGNTVIVKGKDVS